MRVGKEGKRRGGVNENIYLVTNSGGEPHIVAAKTFVKNCRHYM